MGMGGRMKEPTVENLMDHIDFRKKISAVVSEIKWDTNINKDVQKIVDLCDEWSKIEPGVWQDFMLTQTKDED